MKRLGAIFAAVLVIMLSTSVFAANPSTLSASEAGNAVDLIVVKKPETKNSATTKKTYGITGTGKNGVTVAYYKFNGSTYSALKTSGGEISQTKIGNAGVFYKQVSLNEGQNRFAVRAESPNGTFQIVYFDINVLNNRILDNASGFTSIIKSLYNGWIK